LDSPDEFHTPETIAELRIKSGSVSGSSGGAQCPVRIIKFNGTATEVREGFSKYGTQKHIGVSCSYRPQVHTHFFHDPRSIKKREDDTLLRGTGKMVFIVAVEIHSQNPAARIFIFKDPLCS